MEEPIFTLRAQDVNAPDIIIAWVQKITQNPNATKANWDKATAAFKVAMEMLEWQEANPDKVKIPDLNYNMKASTGEANCYQMERYIPRPQSSRKTA